MNQNIIITKEYQEKIRKFAAIRPEETFKYTPVIFREMDEAMKPVFILRPVSGEKIMRFSDEMRGDVSVQEGVTSVRVKRGQFAVNVVKCGLIGWKNYYDIDGNIIEFEPSSFDCIPHKLLEELAEAIMSRSSSSLDEKEVLGLE